MDDNSRITIRLPIDVCKKLEVKAAQENISVSELVRRYIDKGLNLEGYKTEIDFLSDIIQTVTSGVIEPQIERLVKLIIKLGKINGAGYFLQLSNVVDGKPIERISETVNKCNNLAIRYMSQKDSNVEKFLLDNEALIKQACSIKDKLPYGFDLSILGTDDNG